MSKKGVERRIKRRDKQKIYEGWIKYAKEQHGRKEVGKDDHPKS